MDNLCNLVKEAEKGNIKKRNEIINLFQNTIKNIVIKLQIKFRFNDDFKDDLFQEGIIKLTCLIEKINTNRHKNEIYIYIKKSLYDILQRKVIAELKHSQNLYNSEYIDNIASNTNIEDKTIDNNYENYLKKFINNLPVKKKLKLLLFDYYLKNYQLSELQKKYNYKRKNSVLVTIWRLKKQIKDKLPVK